MSGFVDRQTVLFVEDDPALRAATSQALALAGLEVEAFDRAEPALERVAEQFGGIIISDIRMPGIDGLDLFKRVRAIDSQLPVILVTGHADVPMAIGALREGAFDFITKPFASDHLVASVRKALETRRLVLDNRMLRAALPDVGSLLVGDSSAMQLVRGVIHQLAQAGVDVLIEGESGTGKELAAILLRQHGRRANRQFVAINCAALSEQWAETELFGQEAGALGPGSHPRPGLIASADGGTLFLDEIDSAPLSIQAKLLRVVEEREVLAIGARTPKAIDVRIIAAAKTDLAEALQRGKFREDLYYRLSLVRLRMPPLRERRDDIPGLFAMFVAEANEQFHRPDFRLSDRARRHLLEHDWPGNVRELRNFAFAEVMGLDVSTQQTEQVVPLSDRVAAFEAEAIRDALRIGRGSVAEALNLLRLPRKTFYDKVTRHGIQLSDFRE